MIDDSIEHQPKKAAYVHKLEPPCDADLILLAKNYKYSEIATAFGVSTSTVSKWYRDLQIREDARKHEPRRLPVPPDWRARRDEVVSRCIGIALEYVEREDCRHDPREHERQAKMGISLATFMLSTAEVDERGQEIRRDKVSRSDLLERARRVSNSAERLRLIRDDDARESESGEGAA